MAAYRADIEIGVRGQRALEQLRSSVNQTATAVDSLNRVVSARGNLVQSLENYDTILRRTRDSLQRVTAGSVAEVKAIREHVTALGEDNALRARQNRLIEDEIRLQSTAARTARLARSGIRETAQQYTGPIGPGPASEVALSSKVGTRIQNILDERRGRAELTAVLAAQNEAQRKLENSQLDVKAAAVQAALDKQAAAASESAIQTQKLSDRQLEFTQRTDAAARAARAQTAEYIRQQRIQLQFIRGSRASTAELGPGGPGFSGGFTPADRQRANEQARLQILQDENVARRQALNLISREELFEIKLNKVLERNARAVEKRATTREATSNAIIGGAFPLLFGQGLGASIGGGAGGAIGGAMGGGFGFGLSLVGTAAGSAFDQAIQSAQDFSKSLRQGGDAASYLEQRLGILDPTIKKQIQNLQQSGQTAKAAQLAFNTLAESIGTDNAQAFKDLGDETLKFSVGFQRLVTLLVAGAARISDKVGPVLSSLVPVVGGLSAITKLVISAAPALPKESAQTSEAVQRTQALGREESILRTQLQLTTVSAKTDLDRYITLSKTVAQKEYENELTQLAIQLKNGEISAEQRKQSIANASVQLSIKLGEIERQRVQELQRRQEEAARAAKQAAEEAARAAEQALKARLTVERDVYEQLRKGIDIRVREAEFYKGTEAGLSKQRELIRSNYQLQVQSLDVERELAVAEAQKTGTAQKVVDLYDLKLAQLNSELNLETDILSRKIAQTQLSERQAQIDRQRAQTSTLLGVTQTTQRLQLETTSAPDTSRLREQLFLLEQSQRVYAELRPEQEKLRDIQREIQSGALDERALELKRQEFTGQQKFIGQLVQELSLRTELEKRQFKLNELYKQYGFIGDEVSAALSSSITGLITGTQTVAEAFSKMFENIGKAFIDMATQMLAQQLIFTVFRSILGAVPGGGGLEPNSPGGNAAFMDRVFSTPLAGAGYAEGGFVTGPTNALIGEGGEPEYVIPASKMRSAMGRYAAGARGSSVIPSAGGDGGPNQPGGIATSPIDVRYTVERINSVDYVTADQFQAGMQQAAAQGAQRGEQRALRSLQQSTSVRSKVGLR